jgi:hypothetical protein
MKNEDWVLVPPGQEDLLQRGLGSGFRVQFAGLYGKEFVKLMRWHQEMAHLEIFGWVTLNITIPCDKPRPANPTVQQMSRFGYKYRKLQPFKLIETVQGQHYTLKMGETHHV